MDVVYFRRLTSGEWNGNGFGKTACSYAVVCGGQRVGTIDNFGRGNWRVVVNDLVTLTYTLKDAKAEAIRRLSYAAD